MRAPSSTLRAIFSALFDSIESEGATVELELTWLDLKGEISDSNCKRSVNTLRAWHQLGYAILDRRGNSGAALRQLTSHLALLEVNTKERLLASREVFVYAAFVANDKEQVVVALEELVAHISNMPRKEIEILRLLLLDYMLSIADEPISRRTDSLMRSAFGIATPVESDGFLTGNEITQMLDPSSQLTEKLQKKQDNRK